MNNCHCDKITRPNCRPLFELWPRLRCLGSSKSRSSILTCSATLWLPIGALPFCFSCAPARAQQQNPFIGMVQGLDLSPIYDRGVPCADFTKNDCRIFTQPYPARADATTSDPNTRVGTQVEAVVRELFAEIAYIVKELEPPESPPSGRREFSLCKWPEHSY